MSAVELRDQALLMLEGRGAILDASRFVSRLIRLADIDAGLIGGVAVYAHGHRQATTHVSVCVPPLDADRLTDHLTTHGCYHGGPALADLFWMGVPILLDDLEDVRHSPHSWTDVDGLRVMSLAALVDLQLRRATRTVANVGGQGDVVALIRANRLPLTFADQLSRDVRNDFRRLVRAVRADRDRPPPADPFSHSG